MNRWREGSVYETHYNVFYFGWTSNLYYVQQVKWYGPTTKTWKRCLPANWCMINVG